MAKKSKEEASTVKTEAAKSPEAAKPKKELPKAVAEKSKAIKKDNKPKKLKKHNKQLENGLKAEKNAEKAKTPSTTTTENKPTQQKEAKVKTPESIEKKKAKKLAQKEKKLLLKEKAVSATAPPKKKPIKPDTKDGKKNDKKEKLQSAKVRTEPQPRNPEDDASTIFVGNLPISTKRIQLVKHFNKFGPIKSIRLRTASGKKLFKHKQRKEAGSLNAYLLLKNPETAQKALELNGTEFKENHIRVTLSDAKTVKEVDTKRTIFVGNLKYSANEENLREIFNSCGEIENIRCIRGPKGCTGVAYVAFKSPEAVGLALELKETLLDDRPIHVERYSVNKLGSKEAREKAAVKKPGAAQRLAKGKQSSKKKAPANDKKNSSPDESKQVKKEKYSGVKVNGINKKKNQKQKISGPMKQLAKKIAPLKADA